MSDLVLRSVRGTHSLPARAEALAQTMPGLRRGLEALTRAGFSEAIVNDTLEQLEAAARLAPETLSRPHLAAWLEASVRAAGVANGLGARLEELKYALEVIEDGRVADDATVYLGLRPGERVALTPAGPWLEMPPLAPNMKGTLQDLDVVFLDAEGKVQLVEVKRSDEALWHAIAKSDGGKYLEKFAQFRDERAAVLGTKVEVRVVLSEPGGTALDRIVPEAGDTPRNLAKDLDIVIEHRRPL